MIERQTIDGREATVAYLTEDFEPAEKDDADLIKIIYDDGETAWLSTRDPDGEEEGDEGLFDDEDEEDDAEDHSPEVAAAQNYGGTPGEETSPSSETVHKE
jgi:hypothetical protein